MNRITIFHYHLLPGGVTNVILLGVKALIRHFPEIEHIRLVCGREQNTDNIIGEIERELSSLPGSSKMPEIGISVLPEIYYASFDSPIPAAAVNALADRLLKEYGGSFWWVHNYQLGKNPLFTAAIVQLAETSPGQKMLLQIHDFPECARFDNLGKLMNAGVSNPYPVGNGVAYSCINGRDTELLKSAGIPEDRVFLLNNPVEDETPGTDSSGGKNIDILSPLFKHYKNQFPAVSPDGPLLFYPVRSIRRKNILEAGLIAAVNERPVNLAVSLPGVSEQESRYSETCRACFAEGLIPGFWGSGTEESPGLPDYQQMLDNCDLIISSSVQEGFGYLFINAVQLGTPLLARRLDILDGIRGIFPDESCSFYDTVSVPIEVAERDRLRSEYRRKIAAVSEYFSNEGARNLLEAIESLGAGGTVDYSYLPVETQVNILRQVKTSGNYAAEIRLLNPRLTGSLNRLLNRGLSGPPTEIGIFSLESHAAAVEQIMNFLYNGAAVISETANSGGMKTVQDRLLDSFADLKYMRLLYDY